jgi:hypothetical protein
VTTLQHAIAYTVLVVVALLAGALVLHEHDARVRADAIAHQRADSLQRVSDSLVAAHVADSTAAADRTQHLADSLAAIDSTLNAVTARAAKLGAAITVNPDTMVPKRQVLAALATTDTALATQAAKILTLSADTAAWRQRWLEAVNEGGSWKRVALGAQRQLKDALKRSAPRWACVGGVGAAGGLNGAAAGIGTTCGLRIL